MNAKQTVDITRMCKTCLGPGVDARVKLGRLERRHDCLTLGDGLGAQLSGVNQSSTVIPTHVTP